jgi:hypothetical protein
MTTNPPQSVDSLEIKLSNKIHKLKALVSSLKVNENYELEIPDKKFVKILSILNLNKDIQFYVVGKGELQIFTHDELSKYVTICSIDKLILQNEAYIYSNVDEIGESEPDVINLINKATNLFELSPILLNAVGLFQDNSEEIKKIFK